MSKNTHLEHLEDSILLDGEQGAKDAFMFLDESIMPIAVSSQLVSTPSTYFTFWCLVIFKSIYIKYVYNKDFQNVEFIIVNKQIE